MQFRAAAALTKTAFFEFGVNIQNKQLKLKGRWGVQRNTLTPFTWSQYDMCTNGPILKWPRVYYAKNTSLVQNTSLSIPIQWKEHRCVCFLCVRWSNGQQTIMLQGPNGTHLFERWMLIFLIINWCLVLFQWWFIAFFFMRSGYSTWTEVHHVADDVLSLLSAAASCL